MKTEPYHHGNLREALMTRAIEVIEQDGVEALSLRSLARDLGVSHAAPARHFKTRSELLCALVKQGYENLISATRTAGQGVDDPVSKIRAMAKGYIRWAVANPAHHSVMRNPDVSRHADASLIAVLQTFAREQSEALVEAQQTGWNKDADTKLLLFRYIAIAAGAATLVADPLYRRVIAAHENNEMIDAAVDSVIDA